MFPPTSKVFVPSLLGNDHAEAASPAVSQPKQCLVSTCSSVSWFWAAGRVSAVEDGLPGSACSHSSGLLSGEMKQHKPSFFLAAHRIYVVPGHAVGRGCHWLWCPQESAGSRDGDGASVSPRPSPVPNLSLL